MKKDPSFAPQDKCKNEVVYQKSFLLYGGIILSLAMGHDPTRA